MTEVIDELSIVAEYSTDFLRSLGPTKVFSDDKLKRPHRNNKQAVTDDINFKTKVRA